MLRHAVRIEGVADAQAIAVNAAIEDLWIASHDGALPIVVDTSPCAYALTSGEGLRADNRDRLARMRIVDAVEFFRTAVVTSLTPLGAPARSSCIPSARS